MDADGVSSGVLGAVPYLLGGCSSRGLLGPMSSEEILGGSVGLAVMPLDWEK